MAMTSLECAPALDPLDDEILRWLVSLRDHWTPVEILDLPSLRLTALHCCIQTALVELQIPCTAWADDRAARIRGTFFVTGPWRPPDLTKLLRSHFADWAQQRVSIQQDTCQQARLTADGIQAQQDATSDWSLLRLTAIAAAKGMRAPSRIRFRIEQFADRSPAVAAAVASAAIGDVVIHNHIGVPPVLQQAAHVNERNARRPAGTSPAARDAPTKKERIETWLNQYLHDHQGEYDSLLPLVGCDRDAQRRFREIFGPTILAQQFTRADGADGDGRQAASNKTVIQRSIVYRTKIQPLLKGRPPLDEAALRRQQCHDRLDQLGV